MAKIEFESAPHCFAVTRGLRDVVGGESVAGLASAPVVGVVRVARGEHPEHDWSQIDLAAEPSDFDAADVFDEVRLAGDENEIAYRAGERFTNRLGQIKSERSRIVSRRAVLPSGEVLPYRLQVSTPGILTNLSLNETVRRAPEVGEIEVSMKAGGINFRDVMKALGMYPGNPIDVKWFGDDFAVSSPASVRA